MIEEDFAYGCPYCGEELTCRLDPSGGRSQKFVQDCEVCCRPILIEVRFQGAEVESFSAAAEDA